MHNLSAILLHSACPLLMRRGRFLNWMENKENILRSLRLVITHSGNNLLHPKTLIQTARPSS